VNLSEDVTCTVISEVPYRVAPDCVRQPTIQKYPGITATIPQNVTEARQRTQRALATSPHINLQANHIWLST